MASVSPVSTDVTVLKQLTALRLDVSIWSARKKLTPADFGTLELPPEKLASLGSKRVCNPEDLRIFATLKSRAITLLDRHGVRFLGGWAIPETSSRPVIAALESVDGVCIFAEPTATRFLAAAQPDVYVKGGDYTLETLNQEERRTVEQAGGRIVIIPFVPGKSTTALLKKIARL